MTTSTATKAPVAPTWDLESIFPGGSGSTKFKEFRKGVKKSLEEASSMLTSLPETIKQDNLEQWVEFALKLQSACEDIELVGSFAGCLTAQNVKDSEAHTIEAEADVYLSQWKKIKTALESKSLKQSDKQWQFFLNHEKMKDVRFFLEELRKIASSKMPAELEALAIDLSVDGYHAWNRIYNKMAGDLKVEFETGTETETLSMGQIATKMASPDRAIRKQAFEKMTSAWESREEVSGMILNSLAGFRLSLYKNRKWDSVLYEPLVNSRLKQESLDTMWRVIERETVRLKPYIEAKKKLLSIDEFRWYDEFAPVGNVDKSYSFDEAVEFIIAKTRYFSTDLSDFVKMAVEKRWVEAEDRPDKAAGGFCTSFGPIKETRIFMTYAGTYENLLTLAHELGHSYHNWVLRDRQFLAADYPMNLAETASIFAETLVTDAALAQTTDKMEKLMLLEQKIQSAFVMFCDLHTRYLFETSFYAERREGVVGTKRLRELMIAAQKRAFGPLLSDSGVHPLFWCSKLHFYITGAPFYNFPYTFGFLFATGVYDRAKKEGSGFAKKYQALLADTGSMSSEAVAKKHLGVDLASEEFWKAAVDSALSDVDEFVKLAESI